MSATRDHPAFPQPTSSDTKIWRYMDFAKYVALLQRGALYLPRVDQLEDPYEGTLTRSEFERIKRLGDEHADKQGPNWNGKRLDEVKLGQARTARITNYVSCWHLRDIESEAMWRLYSTSSYAIAIQSRYAKFADLLPQLHNGCFIGAVQYIDHHKDEITGDNIFYPIMHKRSSFEHEQEVRVVVWRRDPGTENPETLEAYPPGLEVKLDMSALVDRVIVSPTAPEWFVQVVADVTTRYGYAIPVAQSDLNLVPYL